MHVDVVRIRLCPCRLEMVRYARDPENPTKGKSCNRHYKTTPEQLCYGVISLLSY